MWYIQTRWLKNEQLNFYVNYEGKFGKHSISAMAAVEKMQAYMHSKRMLFNNPDPDGYLGTSPSAGTMDTVILLHINTNRGLCLI